MGAGAIPCGGQEALAAVPRQQRPARIPVAAKSGGTRSSDPAEQSGVVYFAAGDSRRVRRHYHRSRGAAAKNPVLQRTVATSPVARRSGVPGDRRRLPGKDVLLAMLNFSLALTLLRPGSQILICFHVNSGLRASPRPVSASPGCLAWRIWHG